MPLHLWMRSTRATTSSTRAWAATMVSSCTAFINNFAYVTRAGNVYEAMYAAAQKEPLNQTQVTLAL